MSNQSLKTLDPEAREIIINYFTKVLNYSYDETKQIRLLLKLQNLSLDDIIISSYEEITNFLTPQDAHEAIKEIVLEQSLNEMVNPNPTPSLSKIKPIPSKIDIDDLEFCSQNLNYLTPSQKQFITDNFRSRLDNAVTEFNNDPITPKMRQNLNRCVSKIQRAKNKEKEI